MEIRYKVPKIKLNRHQKDFCKLVANGINSIDAYNQSHKHINKVRASTYLQNPFIWDEIIRNYRNEKKETHIIKSYDICVSVTEQTPTQIFYDYVQNKEYYDERDSNPLYSLKRLCFAWCFFIDLDREYFVTKLQEQIVNDFEVLKIMISKNKSWQDDYTAFNKLLFNYNLSLKKILDY
jgi:hypothetical protein